MKSDLPVRFTKGCYAAVIILSIALQVYGHRCGLLLTPDSYNYISASQSFKTDGSFKSPDGSLYTYWPPLFPITLAAFDSPEKAVPWMYAIVTGVIGILSVLILNRILHSNLLKVWVLFLTLTAVQFMMISVFLWSEMNFLLLVLCVIVCAFKMSQSARHWIGLLIFSFLLCLQRNAGVFIVSGICCWTLFNQMLPLKVRLVRSTLIFIAGVSGLVVWNIYLSYGIESGFFFYKHEFFVHAAENFSTLSTVLVRMFMPMPETFAMIVGMILLAGLMFMISKATSDIRLIGLLILFYCIGLVCMFRLDVHDMDRFLSVIVFFLYLILFTGIEKISQRMNQSLRMALFTALLLWMAYPVSRTASNLQRWNAASCAPLK